MFTKNRFLLSFVVSILTLSGMIYSQSLTVPEPKLRFLGFVDETAAGMDFRRYKFEIANHSEFPVEFFEPSPNLPPCGSNSNASRAWINFHDVRTDQPIYGFCAMRHHSEMSRIWFSRRISVDQPEKVYVVVTDRLTKATYRSNIIDLKGSTPTASSHDYQEIRRLEEEWNKANELSDPEMKQSLLAEDSYHVGPSGVIYDKPSDIKAAKAGQLRRSANYEVKYLIGGSRIKMFDGVAVVTGSGQSAITDNGVKRTGSSFRFLHVWEKRSGKWLLTVDQVTSVALAVSRSTVVNKGALPVPQTANVTEPLSKPAKQKTAITAEKAESVAVRYQNALAAKQWSEAARLMHPDALARLAALFAPLVASKPVEIGLSYFGVSSIDEFDHLDDDEVFTRLMRSLSARSRQISSVLTALETRPVGRIDEKPDLAHVMFRVQNPSKSVVSGDVMVRTLKRHQKVWKIMLPSQLEGVVASWRDTARPSFSDVEKMEIEP